MPAVNIEGVGRVNFPDSMTPEQIKDAIENDILPRARRNAAASADAVPVEGPSYMARVGRGAMDILQGAKQRILQGTSALPQATPSIQELRAYASPDEQKLSDDELRARFQAQNPAAGYTARVNDELAIYNKGRAAQGGGFDTGRLLGNVAATAPLAFAGPAGTSVLARAGQGAASGAGAGALTFNPSGKIRDAAINTAAGGVTGAVLGPVVGYVGDKAVQGGRRLIGAWRGTSATEAEILNAVPEIANTTGADRTALIAEARDQVMKTGTLNAEQLARKANLIAQGVTPTRSMVTRSPADWTVEKNLQKLGMNADEQLGGLGTEMTNVLTANDAALANRLRTFAPSAGTQEAHGMTVMGALDDLSTASQKDVSALYKAVRDTQGDQLASDARQLVNTLDDLKDNAYSEKLVTSVTSRLKRYGMIDSGGNPTANTLTITQAEELRKFVNKLPNDFGKLDIIKAIDADVLSGAGSDAFGAARAAASQRFEMLGNPATQRALNALGELSQGKTAQNFIKTNVIDAPAQDVRSLVATLDKIPDAATKDQARNALRSGVINYLEGKAVNVNSGKFSGADLNRAMRDIGEEKLIRVLGSAQYQNLRNLARAGIDATFEPSYAAVNTSNTAPTAAAWLSRARVIPGVPFLLTDNLERAAARIGYANQLNRAMAAQAQPILPAVPPYVTGMLGRAPGAIGLPAAGVLGQYEGYAQ